MPIRAEIGSSYLLRTHKTKSFLRGRAVRAKIVDMTLSARGDRYDLLRVRFNDRRFGDEGLMEMPRMTFDGCVSEEVNG